MRRILLFLMGVLLLLTMTGCVSRIQETKKLRDLEFTVLDRDTIPEEFKAVIESEKTTSFRLTYADKGSLYIAHGYGERDKTGYSVEVKELYETENAIYIHTNLLGPEKGEDTKDIATFPYVAVKLEYIDKPVIFK